MMRLSPGFASACLVLALGTAPAADAVAQAAHPGDRPTGWLGLKYALSDPVTVIEIHPESPAGHAGLQPGDTIVRMNGQTASVTLLSELAGTLAAGDTVHLRLRRGGQDRDLAVVATARPRAFPGVHLGLLHPDSIRARFPAPAGFGSGGDPDNIFFRVGGAGLLRLEPQDSALKVWFYRHDGSADSLVVDYRRLLSAVDSVFRRIGEVAFDPDALHRRTVDSLGIWAGQHRLHPDSLGLRAPFAGLEGFAFHIGRRTVAGAELYELDQGLATYFPGTGGEGLLVLRVAPGTPAARAGLRAGDVIVSANGLPVASVDALRARMGSSEFQPPSRADPPRTGTPEPAVEVTLEVVRRGERSELRLTRPR